MYATDVNARAFLMAIDLMKTVANSLRPEERRDVFQAFFDICKEGLSSNQVQGSGPRLWPSLGSGWAHRNW